MKRSLVVVVFIFFAQFGRAQELQATVSVNYQQVSNGNPQLFSNLEKQVKEFDGISATCLQHEIDHLNGITFVDKISPLKREIILKRMKKIKQNG